MTDQTTPTLDAIEARARDGFAPTPDEVSRLLAIARAAEQLDKALKDGEGKTAHKGHLYARVELHHKVDRTPIEIALVALRQRLRGE